MTRRFHRYARGTYARTAAAVILTASCAWAAEYVTEITLPGTRVFPESITSTSDGTIIVGSLGNGNVSRIKPGKAEAEEWIKAGTAGLNGVLGVFADERGKMLWVCSNNLENKGEATSAKTFDLRTGEPKATYPLPGEDALCNDIAVAADGTAYFTDTRQGSVVMLKPGRQEMDIVAKDPLLAGAAGVAFGDKTILYVNSVTTGKFLRLDLEADGKARSVTELQPSRDLDRPDGMRALGKNRLLMAENSGKMDIVTFRGPGFQEAVIQTLKEGLESTSGVTAARGRVWIVEGKLNYRDDAAFKDAAFKGKDPGPFKIFSTGLPPANFSR